MPLQSGQPVSVEQATEAQFFHSFSTTFHTQSFHKMRCTALTALFFAIFALFSSGFHFWTTLHVDKFSDFVYSHGACCADCSSRSDNSKAMQHGGLQGSGECGQVCLHES